MAKKDNIPEHLMIQVLGYALLMGADYNITRAEEYDENQIIIWYEYKGKTDWILRPLIKNNIKNQTQKIPCFGNTPSIQICPKPVQKISLIPDKDSNILTNINRADRLTPQKRDYYLGYKDYKDTLPAKKVEKIIDVEEIKVQNKVNETPDLIEKVYYESFGFRYEKCVIEI